MRTFSYDIFQLKIYFWWYTPSVVERTKNKPVISNWYGGDIEGSELPADLLESVAVSGVASEPKAPSALRPEDGPAAPKGFASVERGSLAPVMWWGEDEPDEDKVGLRVSLLIYGKISQSTSHETGNWRMGM